MADEQQDLSSRAGELATEFFTSIFGVFETTIRRFFKNFYSSFAEVSVNRWTKVIASVVFYILIRPYIEKLFKYLQERDLRKQREKKEAERAAMGGKKAKMSANALRGGGDGKVLGEVENTDDEVEDDEEADLNLAMASGVPEWNQMARKRQKKYIKNMKKQTGQRAQAFSEEQIMEMLDWSDSDEGEQKEA